MDKYMSLPVAGYRNQNQDSVDTVNTFKKVEERILRELDKMTTDPIKYDQRWLSIGRIHLEQAFMAINRSVFKPERVSLGEDNDA